MCQECDDNDNFFEDNNEDSFLNQIPEHEREDFFNFACEQFRYMIDQADTRNMLYPILTEWHRDKQAAYTMACVMEQRAKQMKKDIEED
jgi:hypothetical protein